MPVHSVVLSLVVFMTGVTEQSTMSRTKVSQRGIASCCEFGMVKRCSLRSRTGITTPSIRSTSEMAPTMVICQDQRNATQTGKTMSATLWWGVADKSLVNESWLYCFSFPNRTGVLACIATTGSFREPRQRDGPTRTPAGVSQTGWWTTEQDHGNGQPSTSDGSKCIITVHPQSTH